MAVIRLADYQQGTQTKTGTMVTVPVNMNNDVQDTEAGAKNKKKYNSIFRKVPWGLNLRVNPYMALNIVENTDFKPIWLLKRRLAPPLKGLKFQKSLK